MTENRAPEPNVEIGIRSDTVPVSGSALARFFSGDAAPLQRLKLQTALIMAFERLWPLLLPAVALLALFMAFSWLGLFALLPGWLHAAILLAFVLVLLASLWPLRTFRPADPNEIVARIERDNGLRHSPLRVQQEHSLTGPTDPLTLALWREHQRRMAVLLQDLRPGAPRPRIPERDPFALRAIVALLFVTGFAYSFSPHSGSVSDAFNLRFAGSTDLSRIDAWVTPPSYTGRPPVFLSGQNQAGRPADTTSETTSFTVPEGSLLNIRIVGGRTEKLTAMDAEGSRRTIAALEKSPDQQGQQPDDSQSFRFELRQDEQVSLSRSGLSWNFTVTPDSAPKIRFLKDPVQTANGTLQLAYAVEDDYGISKAFAEIVPLALEHDEDEEAVPLYSAPDLPLTLPRGGAKEAKTDKDLTRHAWAGQEVALTLVAIDGVGHEARSESKTFTLPMRPFSNPLAKAVVEQRGILALDATKRDHVLDMLSALMLRPEETIKKPAHFLGLTTIRTRLRHTASEDDLRATVDYMWQVATGIEDGDLSTAERDLRQAQQALKDAIARNASQEEIRKLTAELRKAMQTYLREYAERQRNNPSAKQQMPNKNMRVMSEKDLQRMLDQIEKLAQTGSKDQAQELLSQLQDMLNNLQPGNRQAGQQGDGKGGQMQQQMNKLGELLRRQQQTMNETFQLDQKLQRRFYDKESQNGSDDEQNEQDGTMPDNGTGQDVPPELADQLQKLQQQQKKLQSDLQGLMKDLKKLGIKPGKGFSEAERQMGEAGESLGNQDSNAAGEQQGKALESMRNASRDMLQQMQQAMGQGQQGGQQGGQQSGSDPFSRSDNGDSFENSENIVPSDRQIQRAQEILDEIRRRLGKALTPELEKEYLQRLLKFGD